MRRRLINLLRATYPAGRPWWIWDQALLRSNASAYFRRGTLMEVTLICVDFLAPNPPFIGTLLEAAASVLFSLVASMSAFALLDERRSLLDALLGRDRR